MDSEFAVCYNRALALEREGQYAQAAEAYRDAIRINPFDADAQVHLGLILRDLGRDEEANRAFLMALDLQRQHSPSRPWDAAPPAMIET
jgi:Flp pilus assembly protein TadD